MGRGARLLEGQAAPRWGKPWCGLIPDARIATCWRLGVSTALTRNWSPEGTPVSQANVDTSTN
jgi:hypothetical protein